MKRNKNDNAKTPTCKDCMYYESCGDLERCEPCAGRVSVAYGLKMTVEALEKAQKELRELENENRENDNAYTEIIMACDFLERRARREEFTALKEKHEKAAEKYHGLIEEKKLEIQVQTHNLDAYIMNQVFPIVADVLKKYEGKPLGEKTQKKIMNEIFQRSGCYFRKDYNTTHRFDVCAPGFHLVAVSGYLKEGLTDENNKINAVDFDAFNKKIPVFENVGAVVAALQNAKNEILEKMNAYNAAVETYRKIGCRHSQHIKTLYTSDIFYK